jgi:methionyl-tRNA formyltransferase
MKALIVTSRVHFVPGNYGSVVMPLSGHDHVGGLLIVDNLRWALVKTAIGVTFTGAWRLGLQMFRNMLLSMSDRRARAFRRAGKPVWRVRAVNSRRTREIVEANGFDLIVNARTRSIFKKKLLELPARGCINIHHGLLPEQRGVLCDLWALSEQTAAGFSIHVMSEELDDGPILRRVQVSDGAERDFLAYLRRSAERERDELADVIRALATGEEIDLIPNTTPSTVILRKNPGAGDLRRMKEQGMRL